MKKILKTALVTLIAASSVVSLASCGGSDEESKDTETNVPTDVPSETPSEDVESTDTSTEESTETTPGEDPDDGEDYIPEHNLDWVETEANIDAIKASIKSGELDLDKHALFAWCFGGEPSDLWVPILDGKFYRPEGTEACVVAFMPIGAMPDWANSKGQTNDLKIVDNKLVANAAPSAHDKKLTIDLDMAKNNLEKGAVPAEYDLYAFPIGGLVENCFFKVNDDNTVEVDPGTYRIKIVFMEKGAHPTWNNAVAFTKKLYVNDTTISAPKPVNPADIIDFEVPANALTKLKPGQSLPDTYDAYAFSWSNDDDGVITKVSDDGKSVKLNKNAKNVLFFFVPNGADGEFENMIAQTIDMVIMNNKIICDFDQEFTVDMDKVSFAFPGVELPESYDLYIWAFYSDSTGRWVKIENGKFTTDLRCNKGVLVAMPKGMEPDWGDSKLGKSADLDIKDGALVLPDHEFVVEDVEYTVDFELVSQNLKDNGVFQEGQKVFIYTWADGEKWTEIVDGKFTLSNAILEGTIVLCKPGSTGSWGDKVAQTSDIKLKDGAIVFTNNEKPEVENAEYTVNLDLLALNLAEGNTLPTDAYDLYVEYTLFYQTKKLKVVDNKFTLDKRAKNVKFIYVAKDADIETAEKLAESISLEVANGKIKYITVGEITMNEYTFTLEDIKSIIKLGNTYPEAEFDLYINAWSAGILEGYHAITDLKFSMDSRVDAFTIVLVKKDLDANKDNILAETDVIKVVDNAIVYPKHEELEYTVDFELVSKNMKNNAAYKEGMVPYIFVWYEGGNNWIKIENCAFSLDSRINGGTIVLFPAGTAKPDWSVKGFIQTEDVKLENGTITHKNVNEKAPTENKEYTVELDTLALNLAEGHTAPTEGFDLYVEYTLFYETKHVKVVENKFTLDSRATNVKFIYVATDADITSAEHLADSISLELKNGKINYINVDNIVTNEYTFTLEDIKSIIKLGNTYPEAEFDLYVKAWTTGILEGYHAITDLKILMDSRVTEFTIVLVKKDQEANDDNILAETDVIKVVDNAIVYPKHEDVTYEIDFELASKNLTDGSKYAEGCEVFAYHWDGGEGWTHIVDGNLVLDSRIGTVIIVFLPKGTQNGTWDGKIGQTVNLSIKDGNIVYPKTEKTPLVEKTYDLNLENLALNLVDGNTLPTDAFDVYVEYTLFYETKQVKVVENKFTLDSRATNVRFIYVAKDADIASAEHLAESISLVLKDGNILYLHTTNEKKVEYTLDLSLLALNIKEGSFDESQNIYVRLWQDGLDTIVVKAENGLFSVDSRYTNFLIVTTKGDVVFDGNNWGDKTSQSVDLHLDGEKIIYTYVSNTYKVDMPTILANLKDQPTLPDQYDVYYNAWVLNSKKPAAIGKLIEANEIAISSEFNRILFVFVEKGTEFTGVWAVVKGQTTDLTIENNNIVFPNAAKPDPEAGGDTAPETGTAPEEGTPDGQDTNGPEVAVNM